MTKRKLRKLINISIKMYNDTGDHKHRLQLAILKGLYISVGGKIGIPLPPIYNDITHACIIVHRYSDKEYYLDKINEALDRITDNYTEDFLINRRNIENAIDNILIELQVG